MGIAACIIRAVAVQEMCACRHTVVSRLVRKVAMIAAGTSPAPEEGLTNGDLVGVVVEAALCTEGADTCENVRSGRGCSPTDDVSWWVSPVCLG